MDISAGLTTRGLHVEGVNNDGVNVHHYNPNQKAEDVPLIILAGVGANATNSSPIARMGDFKERLNFAPTLFVDYCGRGAAVTTASDGSPKYSVDDDVLPLHFFDTTSGEFIDSPQVRSRARLTIDCGNVSFIMYLLLWCHLLTLSTKPTFLLPKYQAFQRQTRWIFCARTILKPTPSFACR
jgi:hypothetical protein